MYLFKWRSPVNGGKLRSMHGMELPFVFDHVDNCALHERARHRPLRAGQKRWRRPGCRLRGPAIPTTAASPDWPAFDSTRRATMVFDTECRAVNDPYGEERRAMQALR